MGHSDGDGEVQVPSKGRRFGSSGPGAAPGRRHPTGSVSVWCGPGRRTSVSQGRSCGCFVGIFEHQRRVQFEGCVADPLKTITAILPGSEWSCLLLRIVLQDAFSEVTQIYPPLKLRVFVDDITALLMDNNKVVGSANLRVDCSRVFFFFSNLAFLTLISAVVKS